MANRKNIPNLQVVDSINGYAINETTRTYNESSVTYHRLLKERYGMLANRLSKFNCLGIQTSGNIPYVCWMEDAL